VRQIAGGQEPSVESIRRVFGWNGFPDALFYASPWALRFSLGDGLEPGPHRFLQAIDRARAIAAAVFSGSALLTVFAGFHDGERRSSRSSASLRGLTKMGFKGNFQQTDKVLLGDQEHIDAFGKDLCRYWCRADIANDTCQTEILLWASIAKKGEILPKARWLDLYIADLDRGLVLHVYDDRGMDVVGPSKATLGPHYQAFNTWLFDYDRPRMDAVFASAP
jgi:Domain of unknown function (DUF3885)